MMINEFNMLQQLHSMMNKHEKLHKKYDKMKPFINELNCKGIACSSGKDNCKTFEKNIPTVALMVLYVKETDIYPTYILKRNSNHEK